MNVSAKYFIVVVHVGYLQKLYIILIASTEFISVTVSPPNIITSKCESTGRELEPYEEGKSHAFHCSSMKTLGLG